MVQWELGRLVGELWWQKCEPWEAVTQRKLVPLQMAVSCSGELLTQRVDWVAWASIQFWGHVTQWWWVHNLLLVAASVVFSPKKSTFMHGSKTYPKVNHILENLVGPLLHAKCTWYWRLSHLLDTLTYSSLQWHNVAPLTPNWDCNCCILPLVSYPTSMISSEIKQNY